MSSSVGCVQFSESKKMLGTWFLKLVFLCTYICSIVFLCFMSASGGFIGISEMSDWVFQFTQTGKGG